MITLVGALMVPILGAAIYGYGTRIALWIATVAVRLLPPGDRERFQEEWRAETLARSHGPVEGRDGSHHLSALLFATLLIVAGFRRSKAKTRVSAWAMTEESDRSIVGLVNGLVFGLVSGLGNGLVNGLVGGLVIGLVTGLFTGLFTALTAGLFTQLRTGLTAGLATGLFTGHVGGLVDGLVYGLLTALVVTLTTSGWLALRKLRRLLSS